MKYEQLGTKIGFYSISCVLPAYIFRQYLFSNKILLFNKFKTQSFVVLPACHSDRVSLNCISMTK